MPTLMHTTTMQHLKASWNFCERENQTSTFCILTLITTLHTVWNIISGPGCLTVSVTLLLTFMIVHMYTYISQGLPFFFFLPNTELFLIKCLLLSK